MYGFEAQTTGLGGLASQVPGGDRWFPSALRFQPSPMASAVIGGPTAADTVGFAGQAAGAMPPGAPLISGGGSAVERPNSQVHPAFSSVLDFHNSVAPWILLGILVLYGWIHVSVRANARAGRGRVSGAAVL